MTANALAPLNAALNTHTDFVSAIFMAQPDGTYDLTLTLSEPGGVRTPLSVTFFGVEGLTISNFGGGLTQLQCLRGSDIHALQVDRLNFEFNDLEENRILFRCRGFETN